MAEHKKQTLLKANAAVSQGNHEGFLSFCTDDIKWEFVGDQVIEGKDPIRQYMADAYLTPPVFNIETIISEGDILTVVGKISLTDATGKTTDYQYCDVWTFKNGLMAELKAFVIKIHS